MFKRLQRLVELLVVLSLCAGALSVPVQAAAACDLALTPAQAASLSATLAALTPGQTVCLHGGTYPQTQLQIASSGTAPARLTLTSYPGERATLLATNAGGLWVRGAYWTFSNLTLDNGGFANAGLTLGTTATGFTLDSSELRHGTYNGLEVRGNHITITGNSLHDFDGGTVDAECLVVFKTAGDLVIRKNVITRCSGNGIELYTLDGVADPQVSHNVWIDSNTISRGALMRGETLIGVKDGSYITITGNLLSGTQDYNWAMGARGWVDHLTMAGNTLRGNFTGIELGLFTNGGWPHDVVVTGNLVDNAGGLHGLNSESGGGFSLDVNGCTRCAIDHNTFVGAGNYAVFVDGSLGWESGSLTNNLIVAGTTPRLWPGSALGSGVLVSHNGWWAMSAGFLARPDDVTGAGLPFVIGGYSLPAGSSASGLGAYPLAGDLPVTVTATATPTFTPSPTATATNTATPTPTDTATATPSATVGIVQTETCTLTMYSDGRHVIDCPAGPP